MTKDPIICTYPELIRLSQLEAIINKKDQMDKDKLILIIEHRLSSRFLKVIENADKSDLSSFLSMAICCFTIETLECFYEGLPDTKKAKEGARVFKEFFKRERDNFPDLEVKSTDFYYSVRCGLLHQGETLNGWFLQKKGKLFKCLEGIKDINGELFFLATKKAIENYLALLNEKNFSDECWKHAFTKLKQVCENCREINKYDESLLQIVKPR